MNNSDTHYRQFSASENSIPQVSQDRQESQFMCHLRVLLRKQYLTQTRSKKSILCIFISPFLLSLILFLIQYTVALGLKYENPDPPIIPAGTFEKCKPLKGFDSCVSIGYGIFVSVLGIVGFILYRVKTLRLGLTIRWII